jgi:hypothetical protein
MEGGRILSYAFSSCDECKYCMLVTVLGTNLYPYFRSGLGSEQDRTGPNTSYDLTESLMNK